MIQSTEIQMSKEKDKPLVKLVVAAFICGVILALIQAARPIAVIPIIALILWWAFLLKWEELRKHWKEWMLMTLVLALTYTGGNGLWRSYATEQLEQAPPSVPGYNIYVGFNLETNGSYSDTDMDLLQGRYFGEYERDAEAAQQKHAAGCKASDLRGKTRDASPDAPETENTAGP